MALNAALRINMTGLFDDPAEEAKRYQAAIEMAAFVEERGFTAVNMEEHHCADNGWLPAPLTIAAMVIARTQRIRVSVAALLVTLYDPIRLAEDIAVLDGGEEAGGEGLAHVLALGDVDDGEALGGADELGGGYLELGGLEEGGELDEVRGDGGVAGREFRQDVLKEGLVSGGGGCH